MIVPVKGFFLWVKRKEKYIEKIVHKKSILFCLCRVFYAAAVVLLLYALSIHDFHYSIHPLPQMFYETYTNTNKYFLYQHYQHWTRFISLSFSQFAPSSSAKLLMSFICIVYNFMSECTLRIYYILVLFFIAFIRLYTTYSAWLQKMYVVQ